MPSSNLGSTIFDIYVAQGRQYGFTVESWRPVHTYALVRDFGHFVTIKNTRRWISRDPDDYDTVSARHPCGFLVDVFDRLTGEIKAADLVILDSIGWFLHQA